MNNNPLAGLPGETGLQPSKEKKQKGIKGKIKQLQEKRRKLYERIEQLDNLLTFLEANPELAELLD